MIAGVAELIADRIGAMPAGERRAAQTLVANYPVVGL
ncbi:MAG: RpiR family transcriptional regulator, partial [Mesorhizobium sp.]